MFVHHPRGRILTPHPHDCSLLLCCCSPMQMATQRLTVRDVSGHAFIAAYAEHLKKGGKIEVPKWAEYIKTGVARELGPLADDWYFHRAGE